MRRNPLLVPRIALAVVAVLITAGLVATAEHAHGPHTDAMPRRNPQPTADPCPAACASPAAPSPTSSPSPASPASTPPTVAPTRATAPSPRPTITDGFVHPGVFVDLAQLNYVRNKVRAGAQPWRTAYDHMRSDTYASLTWQPRPRADVDCGSRSVPNNGCTEERDDALAAYTDALMWYITGDHRYADHAIDIMDAWAATIRAHTNRNAPIQTGWSGASFARAGELIRYTYSGWSPARINRFATMLRTVYLPTVLPGEAHSNGNHQLIELDAAIGIAVFLNDRAAFTTAIALWRHRMPAYIYLSSDGPLPTPPADAGITSHAQIVKYWNGQSTFVTGLAQETCRDFGHTGWGFEAASQVAATAWIQGVDLYREMRTRMVAALEFHARYQLGAPVPAWLCGGTLHLGLGPVLTVVYNHYHNEGVPLPATAKVIAAVGLREPNYFFAWETLTNADNPYA